MYEFKYIVFGQRIYYRKHYICLQEALYDLLFKQLFRVVVIDGMSVVHCNHSASVGVDRWAFFAFWDGPYPLLDGEAVTNSQC